MNRPRRARSRIAWDSADVETIYVKMVTTMNQLRKTKKDPYVRFEGCPVSVAEQVLFLTNLGKLNSPFMAPETAAQMTKNYLKWRGMSLFKRLKGEPYQKRGACARGSAKPDTAALQDNIDASTTS